jgi:hypothetical protein
MTFNKYLNYLCTIFNDDMAHMLSRDLVSDCTRKKKNRIKATGGKPIGEGIMLKSVFRGKYGSPPEVYGDFQFSHRCLKNRNVPPLPKFQFLSM